MIQVSDGDVKTLMSLPRNEGGYEALLRTLEGHLTQCKAEFATKAQMAVFNPDVRTSALVHSGQVKALEDVVELLKRQVEVGR